MSNVSTAPKTHFAKGIPFLVPVCLLVMTFTGCDVRRNDKISDESSMRRQAALKDSTTVRLIDSVYDFGSRTEGEKVGFNFRFVNTGNKPLVIVNARAGCGCTKPEKPEQPVMPGDTAEIKVVFDSQGRSGRQEKMISVESNANPAFPDLMLKGEIKPKQ
jgi:hypothetical protein